MTEWRASRLQERIKQLLATLIGIGMILAGSEVLVEDGPVGSGLAFMLAGLALFPFIPVPGRGSRTVIFILGVGYGIGMPIWDSLTIHRQTQQAVYTAMDAGERLRQTAVRGGEWNLASPGALPDQIQVSTDGWSRDIQVQHCGGPDCTLLVTLTDPRYHQELRGRSFALWTEDGGRKWYCSPAGERAVTPGQLPATCRYEGAP